MYHLVTPGGFCRAKTSPGLGWRSLHLRPEFVENNGVTIRRLYAIFGMEALAVIPVDGFSRQPLVTNQALIEIWARGLGDGFHFKATDQTFLRNGFMLTYEVFS